MIIDWKDYVDHIFSVTCTNNIKQIDILKNELNRVDILNSGIYTNFINVDSPFYKLIYDNVNKIDNLNPFNGATKLTYAVYYLLRLSYEFGYERIIIMEDDIKFLKDKEELNNLLKYIFNNAPKNFDIIVGNMELVTDYYYNFSDDDFLENKYFRHNNIDADTVYYSCSTINIYSRSGMKKLIDFFEHTYCAIDRYNLFMLNIPDMNLYSIYPWIGVQERYGIEFKNFPQIKNLYNLNDITDNDIYEYFVKAFKSCGKDKDGYDLYWIHPIGRKEFMKRILSFFINKESEQYKICYKIYENE